MRKINPKLSDIDLFKYSILTSLHCYDISFHPERISNLNPYDNNYNFLHITPTEFEINNSNVSLNIFNEGKKYIYASGNNSSHQVNIIQLKNNRYAAIKPLKNKYTQLNGILKSFSHMELKEYVLNLIN